MTKERAYPNAPDMSRRALLTAIPASGLALASPAQDHPNTAILEVLKELESWQGYEASSIVAAKAYAAYRLREALGMELPDPEYVKLHMYYQRESYEAYRRSFLFEKDLKSGLAKTSPRFGTSLT